MKQLLISSLIFLTATISLARGPNSIYGQLGFNSGAANFGLQFEHRLKASHGVAGYLIMASKDDTLGITGVTSFGGVIPVHFGANRWDLYIAPGFGYHMMDFVAPNVEDQNALGALLKFGALYRFTRQIAFGFEWAQLYNWLNSDTAAGGFTYMSLNAKYTF